MRKPRRPWSSEGQEGCRVSLRISRPWWNVSTVTDGWSGPIRSALAALRGTKSYWKHLGWGFPNGFSIWPGFQAIKLHWNICSLTDCCFNNKPMFVLLSSSKEKTLHGWLGLFPGTFCSKAAEGTEVLERSSTLIPSAMRRTILAKGTKSQIAQG